MKRLRIINGIPKYLDCSMGGSYYIDCKILKKTKVYYLVEYENIYSEEIEQEEIPIDDVVNIYQYYNKYNGNYKEDIFSFILDVKHGEISVEKALEIMLNDGEIKL